MVQNLSKHDQSVQKALNDVAIGNIASIPQAAAYHSVPISTAYHRAHGRKPRAQTDLRSKRLNFQQERVLVQWVKDSQRQLNAPSFLTIRVVVSKILLENGDSKPLGQH